MVWLPLPANRLRRAAEDRGVPVRGRAVVRKIDQSIIIVVNWNAGNIVYALENQAQVLGPYEVIAVNDVDGTFGGPTPGVEATPRQFRPPARPTWWGGAWTVWTAAPRRGLLHWAYRYTIDTRRLLLARVGV